MRILNGREIADYMEERQARQVRALRQANHVAPKLAIILTTDNPVIASYVRMKQHYGEDILIDTDIHQTDATGIMALIDELNTDTSVHGIIVQLPLADGIDIDEVVNKVAPEKDVDGLGADAQWTPATAMAIDWLLAGYNVDLKNKQIAIVGNGRLVGKPLNALWTGMGLTPNVYDDQTVDLPGEIRKADLIVTATGVPGLITSQMIKPSAVVVDAGTASENGKIVGDVAADVRERTDLTITPEKGGVGPLTVTALFDNVIRAAQATIS